MKYFITLIFIFTISALSFGFLNFNCNQRSKEPCEILLTPEDDAFKKLFVPMLDGLTQLTVLFGVPRYENDPKTIIDSVNKDIKEEVNQTIIEQFVKKLHGVRYKYPTFIELIEDYVLLSRAFTKKNTRWTRYLLSGYKHGKR
uniref:Uncharacterized protein n=1 Tax=Strongyloides papillosus TaxID=174720 RepID=A0A0N5BD22_STREA